MTTLEDVKSKLEDLQDELDNITDMLDDIEEPETREEAQFLKDGKEVEIGGHGDAAVMVGDTDLGVCDIKLEGDVIFIRSEWARTEAIEKANAIAKQYKRESD